MDVKRALALVAMTWGALAAPDSPAATAGTAIERACGMGGGACAGSPATGRPVAARTDMSAAGGAALRVRRSAAGGIALRAALGMLGVPYSWGGGGPEGPSQGIGHGRKTKGFDCSGLTEYAWANAGVLIGTTTQEQWRSGVRVPKEQIEPGDLVFYDNDKRREGPEHVGLAVNGTRIVDAPYTGEVVRFDPLDRRDFMGVVRPGAGRADLDLGGITWRPES